MAIIGSAYVEIRALDTNLQRDIDKAMKKVKDPTITVQADVNLKPVRDKIRVLREELRKNPLKFSAEVDLDNVNEKFNKLREEHTSESFKIHADLDDEDVRSTLNDIKEEYKNIHAEVKADADTAIAETQMRFLTRHRSTRVSAFVDNETKVALGKLFNTLTGTIPAAAIKSAVLGVVGNFEALAVAGAKVLTVVGSVGAAGLTLGANAVSIAADLGKLVGLAAMAPATISLFGAAVTATVLGWKGFGDALSDDAKKSAKAMALLPPEAQHAANSLRGLGKEIRQTTQASYWKEMAGGIEQLHDNFFPMLKDGLKGTGTAMGKMTKSFTDALWEAGANGSLENMFKHINQGLTNINKGVKPFVDALFTLGSDGSKHLEALGNKIGDLGIRFGKWIDTASKKGDIDRWINNATAAMSDLGKTVGAVYETFQGLNKAAKDSGAKGLHEFAMGMEKIADKVKSPDFQTKLVEVLKGARKGSDALGDGFGRIVDVIGKGTDTLGKFLDLAGQVGGGVLTGIANMFDGTGLGDGLLVALQGAKKAVDEMQPAFHDFGVILGDLAEIAGTLYQQIAPGVVALMNTMKGVVNGVKDGILATMPIFNDFIQNIVALASGPVIALAEGIGNILKGFAGLPPFLQNIIMSLGLAALIAPKIMKGFDQVSKSFTKMKNKIGGGADRGASFFTGMDREARQAAPRVARTFADMNRTVANGFARTGDHMGNVARTTAGGMKTTFAQAGSAMGSAFTAAGKAAGSAVSAMGKSVKSDVSDTVAAAKRGFKDMEILSRPMRANVKNDLKDVAQSAKENTALAGAYVRENSIYMEKRFADVGTAAKGAGKDIVDGFKAVGPNVRTQLNPAITEVQSFASDTRQAFAAVGSGIGDKLKPAVGEVRAFASDTRQAFAAVGSDVSSKFKGAVGEVRAFGNDTRQAAAAVASDVVSKYKNVSSSIGTAFSGAAANVKTKLEPITSAASSVAQKTRTAFTNGVRDIADGFKAVGENVKTHMLPVVSAAETAATKSRTAFKTAALDIQGGIKAIGQNVSSAFLPIATGAQTAAQKARDSFRGIGQAIATNFAPAHEAIRGLASSTAASTAAAARSVRGFASSAGRTISSGIGSALGGLTSAFGGPWGIAIAAITTGIGFVGAKAAEEKGKVQDLVSAFNGQTGINAAVEEFITTNLKAKDSFLWMEEASATDSAGKLGISLHDLTLAAEGVPSAMARVQDSVGQAFGSEGPLQQGIDMLARMNEGSALGGFLDMFQSDAQRVYRSGEEMRDRVAKAREEIQKTADMIGVPVNTATGIVSAIDKLNDAASTADEKVSAALELIKQLNGNTQSAQEAQKAYNEKLREAPDAWSAIIAQAKTDGKSLSTMFDKGTGAISTYYKSGDMLYDMFHGIADSAQKSALTQAQAMKTPEEAVAKYKDIIKSARETLEAKMKMKGIEVDKKTIDKVMSDLGLNLDPIKIKALLEGGDKEQVLKDLGLIDEKKINPKKVEVSTDDKATPTIQELTGVEIPGKSLTVGVLDNATQPIQNLTQTEIPGKSVTIGVLDNVTHPQSVLQAAIESTKGTSVSIEATDGVSLPVGIMQGRLDGVSGTVVAVNATDGVTAPVADAKKAISTTTGKTVEVKANADTKPLTFFQSALASIKVPPSPVVQVKDAASAQIAAIQGRIGAMKGTTIEVKVKDSVSALVAQMQAKISGMRGSNPIVRVIDNSSAIIQAIQAQLDGMRDRTVTVTTVRREIDGGKAANGGIVRSMSSMFGGSFGLAKVKAFASGGVEKHVAQISAGQTPYRVWSEPETGGEAYIPLSKAKRARSTKILEEVARMFGMTLLKTKSFANGGVEGGSSSAGSSVGSLSTSRVSVAMISSIAKEMMKDNTNLNKIGQYVVDGIIGGVNNKSGDAVTAMTGVAGSLEDAVRKRLEIHSPSKTFLGLGKHIVDGLVVGIADKTPAVQKRIATLANQIYVAASDISKATGKSIGSSMSLLNHQKALNKGWNKIPVWKYADQIYNYYKKTGKTGNATLADVVRAREDVNIRLDAANKKLKSLQDARNEVFKSVSNQVRGEYKLGTSIVGQDKPYIPKMRFSDVMNYTSGVASRLRAFNGKIAALKKKGVAPALIQEIAMLGSIEGTSIADAVLSGTNAQVKSLNSQYSQVGAMSNAIGNTTADAMYKVGIDAQAGLVRGLQAESKGLTAAANKLTNTLIAQVKKNLGIRSPSRVFAQLGRFTGEGFVMGLDQMQPTLDKRVDNFINLDPRQISNSAAPTSTSTTSSSSKLADSNITVNVHPTQGMDERAVGEAAIRELGWRILSQ